MISMHHHIFDWFHEKSDILLDFGNIRGKKLVSKDFVSFFQATKKHLSSRIDRVDCSLDECAELTAATREEVGQN